MKTLPVSLAVLYDKVNRTEPAILSALVHGSAERLTPVAAAVGSGTSLPGWRLRVLDGNHLPASEKRLAPLREHRGAALPGQALVAYNPDKRPGHRPRGQRGRAAKRACFGGAAAGQRAAGTVVDCSEIAKRFARDRHFCTRMVMGGWDEAQAGFIVREQAIEVAPLSASLTSLLGSLRDGGASSSRWIRRPRRASDPAVEQPARADSVPRCIAHAGASNAVVRRTLRACSNG